MKKRFLYSAIIPVLALGVIGISTAYAHGWFFGGTPATPDEIVKNYTDQFQREVDILGLTQDEIKSGWAQGKSPFEIAQEHGISQTDLQNKMKELRKQALADELKALVEKGVITQEQADQRLKVMEERIDSGKGFGRHHGFGMMRNGGGSASAGQMLFR